MKLTAKRILDKHVAKFVTDRKNLFECIYDAMEEYKIGDNDLLIRLSDYFESRQDADDGQPNQEMNFKTEIDDLITELNK